MREKKEQENLKGGEKREKGEGRREKGADTKPLNLESRDKGELKSEN